MKIVLILLLGLSLHANIKEQILRLYKQNDFKKACDTGYVHFDTNKHDEEFISLYSFSCLNADMVDRLAFPTISLRASKESRANAAYFSVILMQKKLLYHALLDNYDISIYTFPTTEYALSKVFDLYTKLGKHEPQDFYIFEDQNDSKLTYKLYISRDEKFPKMVIEEFYEAKSLKRHTYW
jgi:hypothetical protein